MTIKNLWVSFVISMLILIPMKVMVSFSLLPYISEQIFTIFGVVWLAVVIILGIIFKPNQKNVSVKKNNYLALSSLVVCVAFFGCIAAYFNDQSKYDFAWQPFMMSFLSILSCVSFVLFSATFFTGKNILNKASFFLYCPVLWFSLYMLIFMSIYTSDVDVFEVISAALLALFIIYYTQVFSTSSNANIFKLVYLTGIPAIISCTISCMPSVIKILQHQEISSVVSATTYLQLAIALHILITLIDFKKQYEKNNNPLIKSISI